MQPWHNGCQRRASGAKSYVTPAYHHIISSLICQWAQWARAKNVTRPGHARTELGSRTLANLLNAISDAKSSLFAGQQRPVHDATCLDASTAGDEAIRAYRAYRASRSGGNNRWALPARTPTDSGGTPLLSREARKAGGTYVSALILRTVLLAVLERWPALQGAFLVK